MGIIKSFFNNVFSRNNFSAEPMVAISSKGKDNPVVTLVIGKKTLSMSTKQARIMWGKLGRGIEIITPD